MENYHAPTQLSTLLRAFLYFFRGFPFPTINTLKHKYTEFINLPLLEKQKFFRGIQFMYFEDHMKLNIKIINRHLTFPFQNKK